MFDNPFIIIGALVALVVVLVTITMSPKKEKKATKQSNDHAKTTSHASSAPAPVVAETSSSTAASAPAAAEKKKPKKKNRSNKTKAQKAKAREAAAAAAAASGNAAPATSEPESSANDDDSDSDSSDDDNVPSGVRFQVAAHAEADKLKAKKNAEKQQIAKANAPKASKAKAPEPEPVRVVEEPVQSAPVTEEATSPVHFDGWAVVEDKRKGKGKKGAEETPETVQATSPKPAPAPEPVVAAPPAPTVETVSSDITVDPKKIGLLIGPKGATKISIQDLTGTNIAFPKADKESSEPVTITVTGPALGVSKAISALNDLVTKGYSTLLEAEDFQESYVAIHPRYLSEVIGKGGSVIRSLQQHTGVRITAPNTPKTLPDGKVVKVKIGLAGRKEKVALARSLIKDLCKFYHTPVTHPGVTHVEMDIDSKYYNYIIGAKGSEIKNIQNSHKVTVHIPNADTINTNLLIVGSESNVEAAKKHIEKIIDRVDTAQATAAANAGVSSAPAAASVPQTVEAPVSPVATSNESAVSPPPGVSAIPSGASWGSSSNRSRLPPAPKPDEQPPLPEEAWMNEFVPPSAGMNLSAMLPATAKFSAPQAVAAPASLSAPVAPGPAPVDKKPVVPSAWNNLSALPADKW